MFCICVPLSVRDNNNLKATHQGEILMRLLQSSKEVTGPPPLPHSHRNADLQDRVTNSRYPYMAYAGSITRTV